MTLKGKYLLAFNIQSVHENIPRNKKCSNPEDAYDHKRGEGRIITFNQSVIHEIGKYGHHSPVDVFPDTQPLSFFYFSQLDQSFLTKPDTRQHQS